MCGVVCVMGGLCVCGRGELCVWGRWVELSVNSTYDL